ncbi:MAG TPA: LysR substrate-binding domain-containing protein [Acidimicrobiales bacterium]|nr:LysR substrate-binding domain-containing protein [Acidimicrobiales bacterium]
MDLRRLEHFLAVADHQGFTAAARAVSVSQPALSLAVKELEAELGTVLFHRLGRRVVVTPAGAALLGPARQALRDVETGRAAVTAVSGLEAGSLAIASLPTLAADPLAGIVGRFRRHHPAVTVDLAAPEDSAGVVAMVRDGRRELGLTDSDQLPEGLAAHPLGRQALVLVLPPGMAPSSSPTSAGTRNPVDLATVADLPFVAAPPGTSTRRLLDEGLGGGSGAGPRVAVVTAQRDAILPLVLAGAGAALVPEATGRVAELQGATVVRPDPPVTRSIVLIHLAGPLAPAALRFVELATDHR